MAVEPKIATIITNTGEAADLPAVGVTCVVGSNNVGKSQLLRDIASLLEDRSRKTVVLKGLKLDREHADVTLEEVTKWLEMTAQKQFAVSGDTYQPIGSGGQHITAQQFFNNVRQDDDCLKLTRPFYCWLADAASRVGLGGGSIGSPNMGANAHPLARLYREGELEERLSKLAKATFGFGLTLDRVNGNVRLMVGGPSIAVPPLNRPTRAYSDAVAALPTLESQGDGVKCFVGLALYCMAGYHPMILIDEPEAFLHQSQAKALGRWVSQESSTRAQQIILATHSRDVIIGLLSGGTNVTVLRLTRESDQSHLKQLATEDLSAVWGDPLLRYSSVLDGLFYESVVICEADADCRFYAAVLDRLASDKTSKVNPDDVLFVPSGGKDRVPKIAAALMALGVKTYAIVDFDVLRDGAKCKQIIHALEGDWSAVNTDYVALTNVLNASGGALWDQVKTQGLAAVPQGTPSQAAKRLVDGLAVQGLLVVPVGELEGFDRRVSGKSSAWVDELLTKRGHESNTEARALVGLISSTNTDVVPDNPE